jgi:hypothetical protein
MVKNLTDPLLVPYLSHITYLPRAGFPLGPYDQVIISPVIGSTYHGRFTFPEAGIDKLKAE